MSYTSVTMETLYKIDLVTSINISYIKLVQQILLMIFHKYEVYLANK